MKHYFHFKRGQSVPQWLISQRLEDTLEAVSVTKFANNGKVMVDDETGISTIWPANSRRQFIIDVYAGNLNILLHTGEDDIPVYIITYAYQSKNHSLKLMSPLVRARRRGDNIRTTTKCKPLPNEFDRRGGVA